MIWMPGALGEIQKKYEWLFQLLIKPVLHLKLNIVERAASSCSFNSLLTWPVGTSREFSFSCWIRGMWAYRQPCSPYSKSSRFIEQLRSLSRQRSSNGYSDYLLKSSSLVRLSGRSYKLSILFPNFLRGSPFVENH